MYRPLGLDGDVYDSGVLLKSVRLSAEVEGDDGDGSDSLYVCDAPVNVLFAKDGEKKTDGFKVLEPLPPPPAKSLSLLPGWTEDFKTAKAHAKKDGKLVYACFSGSDWCYWCKKLEEEVLSDPLFVAGVMDDYVLVFIDSPQEMKEAVANSSEAAWPPPISSARGRTNGRFREACWGHIEPVVG